jgi:hypothetical protein
MVDGRQDVVRRNNLERAQQQTFSNLSFLGEVRPEEDLRYLPGRVQAHLKNLCTTSRLVNPCFTFSEADYLMVTNRFR